MLVYRGMDVGTAKPTAEQRAAVPHHLLDLAEPSERFTVARFQELARALLRSVARPLLVGGSGLYLRAVVDDLAFPPEDPVVRASLEAEADDLGAEALYRRLAEMDPVAAARIEPGTSAGSSARSRSPRSAARRSAPSPTSWDRYDADRVRPAGSGWIGRRSEPGSPSGCSPCWRTAGSTRSRRCMDRGLGAWLTASQAIGYAELAEHLDGRLSLDEAAERTVKRTQEPRPPPDGVVPPGPTDPVVRRRRGRSPRGRGRHPCLPGVGVTDRPAVLRSIRRRGTTSSIIDGLDGPAVDVDVPALCDRWVGAGADGVIRVRPGGTAPFRFDLTNADGSSAEMSGNGMRCLAAYLREAGVSTSTRSTSRRPRASVT